MTATATRYEFRPLLRRDGQNTHTWLTTGSKGETYHVTEGSCSCASKTYGGAATCKHMKLLREFLAEQRAAVAAPAVPVKQPTVLFPEPPTPIVVKPAPKPAALPTWDEHRVQFDTRYTLDLRLQTRWWCSCGDGGLWTTVEHADGTERPEGKQVADDAAQYHQFKAWAVA